MFHKPVSLLLSFRFQATHSLHILNKPALLFLAVQCNLHSAHVGKVLFANIIINILCHKWLLSLKIVTDLQFYLFFLINLLSSNHLILLPANSVFGIYTLAVEMNNLSLFLKYAVDVVFILRPHFLINVSKSTFGT